MQNAESLSQEQIREFLKSSQPIEFAGCGRNEKYAWVERVLGAQNYGKLSKGERGVVRAYLEKVTGMSAAQTTRLIRAFLDHGVVRAAPYQRHRFPARYTAQDIGLLAEVDRAHERLSGPATRRILQREYEQSGNQQYERLAKISVAHLYNLRASARYRNQAAVFEPTRPTSIAIGERRRPDPHGRPGFLRVDTVHQGDWDGAKGVYHINAVDTVTQWQVVGCTSKIIEAYLLPVLEAVLAQFPFTVRGFHVDNGSEYINHRVAKLLEKLHAEFTKSRACRRSGQRAGGRQERRGGAQADRLRIHRRRARRSHREVLCAALKSVSEFAPALRLCHREPGPARQTPAPIQDRGLSDPVGKTKVAGAGRAISQAGSEPGGAGTKGAGDERHRVRPADDRRQVAAAAALQSAVSASAIPIAEPGGRGNAGAVGSMENQTQVFHASHRPLKIPQNRRDFHISTARACTAWKSGKPKTGFPLFHPAHAMTMMVPFNPQKPKKGRWPLRGLLILLTGSPPVEQNRF